MKAQVYALVEARGSSMDLYAVWGTFSEAVDHYARMKGYTPTSFNEETVTDPNTGEQTSVWTFDRDAEGWAWIAQYRLEVTEFV